MNELAQLVVDDRRDTSGRRHGRGGPGRAPRRGGACGVPGRGAGARAADQRPPFDTETGEQHRFSSAILPPWARKTPQIEHVLPLLYLHGLSSGDFVPALGQFLGSTKGLSSSTITKMTETWQAEQKAFAKRDLSGVDYVYTWADGIVRREALCNRVRVQGPRRPVVVATG